MSINAPPTALAVDGLTPRSAAAPASLEELCAALRDANERGDAVIPWGAGRHMSLGSVPSRYDIALRTTKLDRVLEHEPADLTIAVEAGITMGKLQARLAEHGQFLPIDAPADATVGGVLAAGVSGPSQHAYGLPRDWLIGCRIALADGTLIKGGGRVVKNVAGYDMPKLAVGSLGTLGVIVEATFKLAPLPAVEKTLVVTFPSFDSAAQVAVAADHLGLSLRSIYLTDTLDAGSPEALVGFWLAGPTHAVERTAKDLSELTAGAQHLGWMSSDTHGGWWEATDIAPPKSTHILARAYVTPSAVAVLMQAASSLGTAAGFDVSCGAYPSLGSVDIAWWGEDSERLAALATDLRAHAVAAGGSLLVRSAPVEVKQRVDVWGDAGSALPVMRRLKEQFDPRGTLNPGRFVGGL